jgi:hypothetical protein
VLTIKQRNFAEYQSSSNVGTLATKLQLPFKRKLDCMFEIEVEVEVGSGISIAFKMAVQKTNFQLLDRT